MRVKAQRFVDGRRQLADVDAARLRQVALTDAAGKRQCRVPDAEREVELVLSPVHLLRRRWAAPVV